MKHAGAEFKPHNVVEYFDSMEEAIEVSLIRQPEAGSRFSHWAYGTGSIKGPKVDNADALRKIGSVGWKEGAEMLTPYFDAAKLATMNTSGRRMKLDFAGYMPCVPTYLSGDPMHMRRKVACKTSKGPLTIVIGIGSSGGIDNEYLVKRGAALACLVMYLSVFRAVTVYATTALQDYDAKGYYFPMIKIGTSPFDLSTLAFNLAHPSASRGMSYRLPCPQGGVTWAQIDGKSTYHMNDEQYNKAVKPLLGLKDDDLLFPDITLADRVIQNDPLQWAKDRVNAMGYQVE